MFYTRGRGELVMCMLCMCVISPTTFADTHTLRSHFDISSEATLLAFHGVNLRSPIIGLRRRTNNADNNSAPSPGYTGELMLSVILAFTLQIMTQFTTMFILVIGVRLVEWNVGDVMIHGETTHGPVR